MTSTRIHIVLDEQDKARYRRQAELEGKSLAAWLRAAADDRIRAAAAKPELRSREGLERFFADCDSREHHAEPDWESQKARIVRSRTGSLDVT